MNILEVRREFDERQSVVGSAQGCIDPNQFEDENAAFEPTVDVRGPLEDVMADAQHIANKYGIEVKVEARQYDEDAELDWGHRVVTVQPNEAK